MDQTLSLSHQTSPSSPRSVQASADTTPPGVTSPEEEPESPGRSPRQLSIHAAGPDPLAEGIALMAGMVVALMAVLVPLAVVLLDSEPHGASATVVRRRW
jgi:hypothetical protein